MTGCLAERQPGNDLLRASLEEPVRHGACPFVSGPDDDLTDEAGIASVPPCICFPRGHGFLPDLPVPSDAPEKGERPLAATRFHLIYRSYGGENTKGRPAYYSKLLALASFLRAVGETDAPVDVVFVNDGPIPQDRLALMRPAGEIVTLPSVGLKRAWLSALSIPRRRRWDGRDLVWFSEDDYLYLPDAFSSLWQAAAGCPDCDYFTLYGLIGHRPPHPGSVPDSVRVPAGWRDGDPVLAGGHPWRKALSSTATFGARVDAIRQDAYVFPLALASASTWDHTMFLVCQGFQPFPLRTVGDFLRPGTGGIRRRGKLAVAAPVRLALNLAAVRQRRIGRRMMAPDPALATHLESRWLAVGHDWAELARDTVSWARSRGFELGSQPAVE
jgi:hypothetical protein